MPYDKRSTKRQDIVSAALSLFSRTHDVRRVSLEAIAREARVSPATIYNKFGNRETLVDAVTRELVRTNLERSRTIIRSGLPFPQKLTGIIGGKLDMAGNVSNEIITKLITQDETIAPLIDEIYQQEIRPLWKEMVAEGKKQGYIDPALDDGALLVYLDVMQAGFKARPELFRNFEGNIALIKQLMRLMYYGFLKKDIDVFENEG
ncbi:MAG: TetR/AcrR family transcriptional regulator [Dehalococcoidia bacterium]|nr:TetR/AcrR family transcriptional regulator [Dehalococcoidia bacterium]